MKTENNFITISTKSTHAFATLVITLFQTSTYNLKSLKIFLQERWTLNPN